MKFKKIKINNIRSYKDQEIVFPEGSLLLSGDVGCGKTSVLLAIEYSLFGLQPGQKGNSLLRNNEQSGGVSLDLEVGGRKINIERRLKRTQKGVTNDYASITIDGERFESSVTEIKSKIMDLLGYPPEFVKKNNVLYRYTVHTAQEQMKQIILEDPETRLNILRHVFGIDKYRLIKENSSSLITNLKGEVKMLQGEISTLESDKENQQARKNSVIAIKDKISSRKVELSEKILKRKLIEEELKEIDLRIDDKKLIESEIEKTKILLSNKKEMLSSILNEEEELRKLISEELEIYDEKKHGEISNELTAKKKLLEETNYKHIDIISKFNSFKQEKESLISKKDRIFKIHICPTCLQDVSEHHKHNILNEVEGRVSEINRNFESLEKDKIALAAEIDKIKKNLNVLEEAKSKLEILKVKKEHLDRSKKKISDLQKNKQTLENDQALLFAHIESLKEKNLKYSPFEMQYKKKELELKQAVFSEKETEIALAELEKELEISHREISWLEVTIKKKEESKKKLYELNELIDWMSSQFLKLIELIERNVLLKLRKEFSSLFRKWFLMLVAENSLDSQIDDNFTPVIIQGETEMDYSFLSGGERTAVALAYRLALNQTINSILSKIKTRGLIILDEPTDGFSEVQINKIRDILEELNAEQLIIVSHEQEIEGFVDNVLKVTKEGDCSVIEQSIGASPVAE